MISFRPTGTAIIDFEVWVMALKNKISPSHIGSFRRDLKRAHKLFAKIPLKPRQVLPMNGEWRAAVAGAGWNFGNGETGPAKTTPVWIVL
jgi:hypothetical protein